MGLLAVKKLYREELYAVFSNFAGEAIKRVYETVKPRKEPEKVPVKVNCS